MKSLLVVVDYQNDFVDGALGFNDAVKIYENVKNKIKKYEDNNDDVIFTSDTHKENYLNTIEGKSLPIKHCIEGSEGHKFYKDIDEMASHHLVLKKDTFPCAKLFTTLVDKNYEMIEVIGVVTNICVLSNAIILKSLFPDTIIKVDSKCCASNNKELEKEAYDILRNLFIEVE